MDSCATLNIRIPNWLPIMSRFVKVFQMCKESSERCFPFDMVVVARVAGMLIYTEHSTKILFSFTKRIEQLQNDYLRQVTPFLKS